MRVSTTDNARWKVTVGTNIKKKRWKGCFHRNQIIKSVLVFGRKFGELLLIERRCAATEQTYSQIKKLVKRCFSNRRKCLKVKSWLIWPSKRPWRFDSDHTKDHTREDMKYAKLNCMTMTVVKLITNLLIWMTQTNKNETLKEDNRKSN